MLVIGTGLGVVGAYHVTNVGPADRTLTIAADALPLPQCTGIAHAHVPALVEHTVDHLLKADRALAVRTLLTDGQ